MGILPVTFPNKLAFQNFFIYFFLKIYYYLFERQAYREGEINRKRERISKKETFHLLGFIPQMAATVGEGPD